MTLELNESKRRIQSLLEKASLVEQKLEDMVLEANMHKERVESMLEENRKLVTEAAVAAKNIENQKLMIATLEK